MPRNKRIVPTLTDVQFLRWLANRLVHVYHENENVDFVLRLRTIAEGMESGQ